MAHKFPNINAAIHDELPKWKLKEDETAVADVALTRGQSISLVASANSRPHANIAAAGAQFWIVMDTVAAGALVRYREMGCAPAIGGAAINAGANVMADGAGNVITHVNGNWIGGYTRWPCSGITHEVQLVCYQAYR